MRVIRKYANRRLYDTQQSHYVTLEDLRRLVLDEVPFRVEDAKSGEDLTRPILLSIITEQEQRDDNQADVFSNALLEQLIRIYAMAQPLPLARYLEQGTQLMLEQQRRMQDQWQQAMRHSPVETMHELAEENLRFWQRMMRQNQAQDDDAPER
ncbi:polyhydroxyalkanoate synthesis repressor PhaR [Chromohalobacter marismortui]|uniref:Polyhydroxyalkanoate synthesis repressor PhaR n=1 Tax=Chromohalobacter marismortui TaxID=42055 RepID=A0A4R7NRW3_9GAMM|nr:MULTISPECIES: polyhydroxyalkanoate synthesis repressor PhaR [Chromohalobacter]MCI0511271.1 polyhydroxyalkanoate synthesis repressor PhaR [Chromohalobacter sp.]MCI0593622.1 polyhydroxyalkanoate synthesis repressor PhaR [Chromohalobacter sp.]TDU23713.1 polyhydroxyalkanoate synthesis repressor PhaR [Chromohalobacter marismortui]